MSKRKTVMLELPFVQGKIKKMCRSNVVFAERMQRSGKWVSDWKRGRNLPSPEEAARMCVILQVGPEEILTEQEDIELVTQLLESQKQKPTPEGEPLRSEAKQKLVDMIDDLDDAQCEKLYKIIMPIITEAKELF